MDDTHTGVWHPRESTSLWKLVDAEERRIATINEAGVDEIALQHGVSKVLDGTNADAWAVQLQVVKRSGTYKLLIDGMVAERNDDGFYKLQSHSGLLRNTNPLQTAQTAVFSPCAVSVFVEDGERMPQKCEVRLVQGRSGLTGQAQRRLTLMDAKQINAFTASDIEAETVLVPFPGHYPRHGRIAIFDLTKLYKYEYKRNRRIFFSSASGVVKLLLQYEQLSAAAIAASDAAARAANAAAEAAEAAGDAAAAETWSNTILNAISRSSDDPVVVAARQAQRAQAASSAAAQARNTGVTEASLAGLAAALALFTAYLGISPLSAVLTSVVKASPLASGGFSAVFANPVTIATTFFDGLNNWMNERTAPEPRRVSFTIAEFAEHLEVLSELVDVPDDDDLAAIVQTNKFQRELLIFKWFLEPERGTLLITGFLQSVSRRKRGMGKPNPIDLDELEPTSNASMFVDVNVVIEDSEICGEPTNIAVRAARDKNYELIAALASGALQDIERLEMAMNRFISSIDEALERLSGTWWRSNRATSFFHAYFLGPVFNFVARKLTGRKREEGLIQLGIHARSTLNEIKARIPDKLERNFLHTGSRMQLYKKRLEQASQQLINSSWTAQIQPLAGEFYLRFLPQATKRVLFFPSAPDGDTNYAENAGDEALAIRLSSAFTDSCKAYNEAARGGLQLLRDMEDSLKEISFTHFFNGDVPEFGKRLRQRVNFNALHVNTPASAQYASSAAGIPEELRVRLASITTSEAVLPTTALDALGVSDTHHALQAVAAFCQFLSEELVAAFQASDKIADASRLVNGPFQSAMQRLSTTSKFVAAHCKIGTQKKLKSLLLNDYERLLGPRAGRDAATILEVSGAFAVRSVDATISILKATCAAADDLVRRLQTANDRAQQKDEGVLALAARMPSEPLASLFLDKRTGSDAFLRITRMVQSVGLDPAAASTAQLVWSVASSYASNLLMRDGTRSTALPPLRKPPRNDLDCRRAINRMAALRLDVPGSMVSNSELYISDVASLSEVFARSLVVDEAILFYAPFGYGDAPPVLKFPASAPSLLGSVPVWCEDVRWAMAHTRETSFVSTPDPQPVDGSLNIQFVYEPCFLNAESAQQELAAPALIKVQRGTQTTATVYGVVPPSRTLDFDDFDGVVPTAAKDAVVRLSKTFAEVVGDTVSLRETVSSVLWNADRMVQAVLALLHVCDAPAAAPVFVRLLPDPPDQRELTAAAAAIAAQIDDESVDRIGTYRFPNEIVDERRAVVGEARTLYLLMRELAGRAGELAEEAFNRAVTINLLENTPFDRAAVEPLWFGAPWARGQEPAAFARRVLTVEDVGTEEDALYIAANAVNDAGTGLVELFKEQYSAQPAWNASLGVDWADFFDEASSSDEYLELVARLDEEAVRLTRRYRAWVKTREEQLRLALKAINVNIENTRSVSNRWAQGLVASIVIAKAILSDTVGRPFSELILHDFANPLLKESFRDNVAVALDRKLGVSTVADEDVVKLSELCGITLDLVESSV